MIQKVSVHVVQTRESEELIQDGSLTSLLFDICWVLFLVCVAQWQLAYDLPVLFCFSCIQLLLPLDETVRERKFSEIDHTKSTSCDHTTLLTNLTNIITTLLH